MTTIIRLNTEFANPDLPVAINHKEKVASIPSLFGWYNADAGGYNYDVDGEIYLIDQAGGNVNLAYDPSRSNPGPTLVESAVNGRNALQFSNAGEGLRSTADAMPASGTFYVVFIDEDTDVSGNRYFAGMAAALNSPAIYASLENEVLRAAGPGVNLAFPRTSTWRGAMESYNSSDLALHAAVSDDWSAFQSGTASSAPGTFRMYMGGSANTGATPNAKIAELIILDSQVQGANDPAHQTVTAYLNAKYGL